MSGEGQYRQINGLPLRFALVGHGVVGAEHASALSKIGCPVLSVVGPSEDKAHQFALEKGIPRWTTSLEKVTNDDDIDAVIVASPNDAHAEQTLAVIRAGKHVLCEVPLATSYADASRVASALAGADTIGMVCQTQRFMPSLCRLRSLVELGQLDPIQLISITGLRRRKDENTGWKGVPRSWVDSVIWHQGSHALDTALWLLDDTIVSVEASGARLEVETGNVLDLSITIRTASGRLATIVLSYSSRLPLSDLIVVGEERTFQISNGILRESGVGEWSAPDGDPISMGIAAQDTLFVNSVLGRAEPSPTPADLLPLFELLQGIERQVSR